MKEEMLEKRMKKLLRRIFFWLVIFIIFLWASSLAKADVFKWSQLGRAPLMPEIEDRLSLQEKFFSYRGDVLEGLRMAEPAWDAADIFGLLEKVVRSDRVEETSFTPGQKFLWMIFKPKGRVGLVRDVQWVGEENLTGFLISLTYKELELKFFLPKKCGNLTLLEERVLPAAQAQVPSPLKVEPIPPIELKIKPPPPIRIELEPPSPIRVERAETQKRRWWIPVIVGAAAVAAATYFGLRECCQSEPSPAEPPTVQPPTVITR